MKLSKQFIRFAAAGRKAIVKSSLDLFLNHDGHFSAVILRMFSIALTSE